MVRAVFLMLLLPSAAFAQADPAPVAASQATDPEHARDAAQVVDLNRSIIGEHDAVRARNDSAEAQYRRQLAEYRAALDANDAAKAKAAQALRAYEAERASYDAALEDWRGRTSGPPRQDSAPRVAAAAAAPVTDADAGSRTVCKWFTFTGSLIRKYRSCKTEREWAGERTNIRAPSTTSGSCRPPDC